ncbi:MAG: cold-shock protein [Pseudomonadota bacterium]
MANGTVLSFKADKGYGFIKPDDGTANIYFHVSSLGDIQPEKIVTGVLVSYESQTENDKISAINIKMV